MCDKLFIHAFLADTAAQRPYYLVDWLRAAALTKREHVSEQLQTSIAGLTWQ